MLALAAISLAFAPAPLAAPRSVTPLPQPRLMSRASSVSASMIVDAPLVDSVTSTLAFADQAGNLAGLLFPASLPAYVLFLYFICQDVNGLSQTSKAGFTSLLAFVTATVVTSIISKVKFDLNLANVDWLHSGAEQLLSFTNIANVIGLKLTLDAFSSSDGAPPPPSESLWSSPVLKIIAGAAAVTIVATWAAAGGELGAHTAYLGGIGNLPDGLWTLGFPEPANALSMPTWVIHVASLLEWLVAMGLVWRIGSVSGNPKWKGLTWGMIPSHSSGVVACVYVATAVGLELFDLLRTVMLQPSPSRFTTLGPFCAQHFFYNAEALQFLVTLQAALTLLGNCTLAYAAWRLAVSNGWTFALPAFGEPSAAAAEAPPKTAPDALAVPPSVEGTREVDASGGDVKGLLVIFAWSIAGSYLIKYGETLLPFVADGDSPFVPVVATLMVVAATGFNCWKWQQRSQEESDFGGLI